MRKPFVQLLSINVFIRRGSVMKQVSVMYIIMSGQTTEDYVKCFKVMFY